MSGIENVRWVATVNEDNLLVKNGAAVTGAEFVFLLPVSAERLAHIKQDGVGVQDMMVSKEPMAFCAISLEKLIRFAIDHGMFQEPETKA
jgi:hypothetical protein